MSHHTICLFIDQMRQFYANMWQTYTELFKSIMNTNARELQMPSSHFKILLSFLSFFGLFCDSFKAQNTLFSIHIAILSLVEVGIKKRAIVYGRVVCDVPNWFCSSMKVILLFFVGKYFFCRFCINTNLFLFNVSMWH